MNPFSPNRPHPGVLRRTLATLAAAVLAAASVAAVPAAAAGAPAPSTTGCQLQSPNSSVKHVIQIQFDNTHFRRDNPNVPSDLEQMPNLLNFIKNNGTLMTDDHTVLISHTATGILSTLTGVYPDRMGQPVSNSFRYFTPSGASRTGVAFAYWTAPLFDPAGPPFPPAAQTDLSPEMINEQGKVAPAPWVPYTRAGCDFGSVATANTILENTGIDVATVFGPGSPEAIQAAADSPGVAGTQTFADYVGIGVHCAQGSAVCATANHGRPDLLTDEPADPATGAAYTGFNGLFGAKYVDPQIGMTTPTDLDGNPIKDANNHVGFPGFDGMEATVSLSWVAHMQESGIPVTTAYISDAHDGHGTAGNIHFAYGPGEAGYVQQLQAYDQAFGKFFSRLANDGINKSNTLFIFTVDEGDHFAGDPPSNAGCDGVTTPCTYNRVGEINADLHRMLLTQFGDTTPFAVHSDDAPNVYVTGNPARTDPAVRQLGRESGALSWLNPYTSSVQSNIIQAMADPVEEATLHMVTADPFRTPTLTLFADPQWFFFSTAGGVCPTPVACATIPPRSPQSFAWNHGDIQDEIASTWVGYVGPGVKAAGQVGDVWTDHTDVRPTTLSLLGLTDDNVLDGRVVTEILQPWAIPTAVHAHGPTWQKLAAAYKQLNASFGEFSMATLAISTRALASGTSSDDSTYTSLENQLLTWTAQRNALATQMKALLNGSAFHGTAITEQGAKALTAQANALIGTVLAAAR
jgi:hypothetical protein